jgi:hypothetical protein
MTIARGRAARDSRHPACLLQTNRQQTHRQQGSPGERWPRGVGPAQAGLNRCAVIWQRRSTPAVVAAGRRTPSAPGLPSAAPADPTCARHGVGRGQLDPSARSTAILERLGRERRGRERRGRERRGRERRGRAHDVRWSTAARLARLAATRDGQG